MQSTASWFVYSSEAIALTTRTCRKPCAEEYGVKKTAAKHGVNHIAARLPQPGDVDRPLDSLIHRPISVVAACSLTPWLQGRTCGGARESDRRRRRTVSTSRPGGLPRSAERQDEGHCRHRRRERCRLLCSQRQVRHQEELLQQVSCSK